jgi:hypothetical protein
MKKAPRKPYGRHRHAYRDGAHERPTEIDLSKVTGIGGACHSTRDAQPVVLKVQFPDQESTREADALTILEGDGAIQLLEHDPTGMGSCLCSPGTSLAQVYVDALAVLIDLLPRLWKSAGPLKHGFFMATPNVAIAFRPPV